jgi:uncharacterized membrane protein YcaP (DUF421 family)
MNDLNDVLHLFRLSVSPVEIIIRGTAMYWFLFALFRFVIRRDVGSIAIADILLLVLIADASQNAMAGSYESISDGCILVATIAGWNYLLDWASYHSPAVRRIVAGKPLLLIDKGRILRGNMRRELITVDELNVKLREEGIDSLSDVRSAYMEVDGEISLQLEDDAKKPEKPK